MNILVGCFLSGCGTMLAVGYFSGFACTGVYVVGALVGYTIGILHAPLMFPVVKRDEDRQDR